MQIRVHPGVERTANAALLMREFLEHLNREQVDVFEASVVLLAVCELDSTLAGSVLHTPALQRKWRETFSAHSHPDGQSLDESVCLFVTNNVLFPVCSPSWTLMDEERFLSTFQTCTEMLNSLHENVRIAFLPRYSYTLFAGNLRNILHKILLQYASTRRVEVLERHFTEESFLFAEVFPKPLTQLIRETLAKSHEKTDMQYLMWWLSNPAPEFIAFFGFDEDTSRGIGLQFKCSRCLRLSNESGDVSMGLASRYMLVSSWWGGQSREEIAWKTLLLELQALTAHALATHEALSAILDLADDGWMYDHSLMQAHGHWTHKDEREQHETDSGGEDQLQYDGYTTGGSSPYSQELDMPIRKHTPPAISTHPGRTCCTQCLGSRQKALHPNPTACYARVPPDETASNFHTSVTAACLLALKQLSTISDETGRRRALTPEEVLRSFQFRWRAPLSLR
jgi:hypothetical protein